MLHFTLKIKDSKTMLRDFLSLDDVDNDDD